MSECTHDLEPQEHRDEALFLLVLTILLFSTLDGIFTLLLLETGQVHEWNPIMAPLIDGDVQQFANVKTALTTGGLFVLAIFADRSLFRRIRVRRIIELIFVAYALLMVYHFSLMLWISG